MAVTCTRKFGVLHAVGEEPSCMREVENYRDLFAVAVVKIGSNRRSRHKLGIIARHLEIADIPVKEAQQQQTGVK